MNQPWVYMCPPSWTPLPPPNHPIPQGHPSALALSTLPHVSKLDSRSIPHMVIYMFQCHSLKSSHPCLLPQYPKFCIFLKVGGKCRSLLTVAISGERGWVCGGGGASFLCHIFLKHFIFLFYYYKIICNLNKSNTEKKIIITSLSLHCVFFSLEYKLSEVSKCFFLIQC